MPRAAVTFAPLAEAVAKLSAKTPIGSLLSAEQWAEVPLALRERAQFSARVESVRVMATIQDKLLKRAGMLREQVAHGEAGVDVGSFIRDVKQVMREEGLDMGGERIRDASSAARLKLIWDHQMESAASYARWKSDQDPDALDNFPATEFLRVESREEPRDWAPRWDEAFSPFKGATRAAGGRLVALKNHPGWTALSRFGTPWPPFDYGSGMGVESVSRQDAIALGLLGPDDHVQSIEREFNDGLEASVKDVPQELRAKLQDEFGDQVQFEGDRAVWQGNLIGDLVDRVEAYGVDRPFDSRVFKGQQIDLGQATQRARELAAPHMDISRMKLKLAPDNIKHFFDSHGLEGETRGDQRPITKLDVELVPHVWRNPDKVEPGKAPRSLVFWKRLLGKTRVVEWQQYQGQSVMIPTSMLIKNK